MAHKTSAPPVLLLCLALLPAAVVTAGCISKFYELEKSLLSREANLDALKEAFFPDDRQASITVEIYYYMARGNMSTISSSEALNYDHKFRWTLSPVHVFVRPALLECLSLYVYQPSTVVARLIVDPICNSEETDVHKSDSTCNNMDTEAGTPVRLLNKLTTHLKSYVLYEHIREDTRGYASYYYDHDHSEIYCVIGYEVVYRSNRRLLGVSAVFLLFFLAFAIPATFAYSYDTLYHYAKKKPNAQYFIWAVVMGTTFLYPLILISDFWIIIFQGFYERSEGVFSFFYIIALAIIIILPFLDFICVLLLWFVSPGIFKKDFPIPHPSCSHSCHNTSSCSPIFIQIAAVILFTLCFQHLSFHGIYILLGFVASPLQATSLLAFYSAAVFSMVSSFAVILKVVDIKIVKKWKVKDCVKQVVLLPMVVLFVGFVSCFIAFYVQSTIMVGEYRNAGGVTSFIVSLVPSVMLSGLGFIGKKLVDITRSTSNVEANSPEVMPNLLAVEADDNDGA